MALSGELTDFSMSLCATLASVDIATVSCCDTTQALAALLASETGEQLFDDSLKLWWESPRNIATAYLQEIGMHVPTSWDSDWTAEV
ncbi:MAG: hypothetical protein IKG21_08665 [Atopobiaceae bacterium]|nr:hypothetical protein [Atopobiaceae bacterium]